VHAEHCRPLEASEAALESVVGEDLSFVIETDNSIVQRIELCRCQAGQRSFPNSLGLRTPKGQHIGAKKPSVTSCSLDAVEATFFGPSLDAGGTNPKHMGCFSGGKIVVAH